MAVTHNYPEWRSAARLARRTQQNPPGRGLVTSTPFHYLITSVYYRRVSPPGLDESDLGKHLVGGDGPGESLGFSFQALMW
jgi:hypothetical protein